MHRLHPLGKNPESRLKLPSSWKMQTGGNCGRPKRSGIEVYGLAGIGYIEIAAVADFFAAIGPIQKYLQDQS